MLDMCPNCGRPVIYASPGCRDHTALQGWKQGSRSKKNEAKNPAPPPPPPDGGTPTKKIALEKLLGIIISEFGVAKMRLLSGQVDYERAVVFARRFFMYVASDVLHYSYDPISEYLGLSRTSIGNGVTKIRKMLSKNKKTEEHLASIKKKLEELDVAE